MFVQLLESQNMANDLISVWWDIDSCQVTHGCTPEYIMDNVKHAIAGNPSAVSLTFFAIGNMSRVSHPTKVALEQSGIILIDFPQTGEPVKARAPRSLTVCHQLCRIEGLNR